MFVFKYPVICILSYTKKCKTTARLMFEETVLYKVIKAEKQSVLNNVLYVMREKKMSPICFSFVMACPMLVSNYGVKWKIFCQKL